MKNLRSDIKEEYERSLRTYSPSEITEGILSEKDVFDAHFLLADFFTSTGELARFGILNFDMLSSAVARQSVGYGKNSKWNDPYSKIATLTFGLTKDHAFQDGNKRTALLCMIMALHRQKRRLECKKSDLEILLVRIAANTMNEYKTFQKYQKKHGEDAIVVFTADLLKSKSRPIDNRFRTLTYEEFNQKLKQYDVWLDNPNGAFIDVMQKVKGRKLFGLIQKDKPVRRLQIGFPGMKRQINLKAVNCVLQATGLTPENGIDRQTFYEGTEPEYRLIEEYFEILKRLKDR